MLSLNRIILSVSVLLSSAMTAASRNVYAGLLNSAFGYGICTMISDAPGTEINTFSIKADTYGLLSGRTTDIGIAFSYTRDYVMRHVETGSLSADIYFGAGIMAGYVHDHESGIFSMTDRQLTRPMGIAAALACTAGARCDFDRRISIDLRLNAAPGVHIRHDETNTAVQISLYKNGIIQTLVPSLCIMYRF